MIQSQRWHLLSSAFIEHCENICQIPRVPFGLKKISSYNNKEGVKTSLWLATISPTLALFRGESGSVDFSPKGGLLGLFPGSLRLGSNAWILGIVLTQSSKKLNYRHVQPSSPLHHQCECKPGFASQACYPTFVSGGMEMQNSACSCIAKNGRMVTCILSFLHQAII